MSRSVKVEPVAMKTDNERMKIRARYGCEREAIEYKAIATTPDEGKKSGKKPP